MAGQVLKVLLTFQIFEYSSLHEDLRAVSTVGIISPQLEWCRDNDDCSSDCISFEGDEQPDDYITEFANRVYASLDTVALPETILWIRNQAEVASEYGVDLIAYEGEQHLAALYLASGTTARSISSSTMLTAYSTKTRLFIEYNENLYGA